MKTILFVCTLCLLSSFTFSVHARSGVYVTYEDFKKGKLMKADDKTFSFNFNNKTITMKVNGEKQKFLAKDTWGYLEGDQLYRILPYTGTFMPCELICAGEIYAWEYSKTTTFHSTSGATTYNDELIFISPGVNGQSYLMWKKKQLEDATKVQPKFKPVMECAEGKKTNMMHPYLFNVLECVKDQPGNISDLKSVIPPDSN